MCSTDQTFRQIHKSPFLCHPLTWPLTAPQDQAVTGFLWEKGCLALWTPGVGFLWWICRICLFLQHCRVCYCYCWAACSLPNVWTFSLQTLCHQQSIIWVKGRSAVEALYSTGKFGRQRGFWHLFRKLSGYLPQSDKRLSVVLHPK